jgi:hypothetical protein
MLVVLGGWLNGLTSQPPLFRVSGLILAERWSSRLVATAAEDRLSA